MKLLLFLTLIFHFSAFAKLSGKEKRALKKNCEERGFAFDKKDQKCSTITKSKKHNKCIKNGGVWEYSEEKSSGKCIGAKSKKELKCLKNGGTFDADKNKCSGEVSTSAIKKIKKACEKSGFIYDAETNKCSETKTSEALECEKKSASYFENGKCKLEDKSKEMAKEVCEKLGWKYDKSTNACSTKKKTKDRVKCDRRYKLVNGQRERAIFENGICSISKEEMAETINKVKKECAEKGFKYDKLTFGCSEFNKTKKGKKLDRQKIADDSEIEDVIKESDNTKTSKVLSHETKDECHNKGFEYDKFKGICSEKKTKFAKKCEERGGVITNGECLGGLTKKEFRKKERADKKQKAINDKEHREKLFKEAKEEYQECLKSEVINDKKRCKFYHKLEKRYIKAMYGEDVFRSESFSNCLKNALAQENQEQAEGIDTHLLTRIMVSNCYKERNKKLIKSALVGVVATSSFLIFTPGAGAAALAMVIGNGVAKRYENKLTEIENQVIEHMKNFALQEGRRLTQKTIDEVLTDVRTEYYKQLGIEPKTENDGVKSDIRLTKKEQKRLEKIENRTTRHWKKDGLRLAKENYKECITKGVLSKDQCKYARRLTEAKIKSQAPNKLLTSEFKKKCFEEAAGDEAKAAECIRQGKNFTLQSVLLVAGTGGLIAVSPNKMQEYLLKRLDRVQGQVTKELIDEIENETIDILIDDSLKGIETVTQPTLDEGMEMFRKEFNSACIKLKIDCATTKVSDMTNKDRETFYKVMEETARQDILDKYNKCLTSKEFTKKQCEIMEKMDERFVKAKYNSGFLRGRKFNSCLDRADKKFEQSAGSIEHKFAINQCFQERNKRRVKFALITLTTAAAVGTAYALNVGGIKDFVDDFVRNIIKDQLGTYGAEFEEDETYRTQDIEEYSEEIVAHQGAKLVAKGLNETNSAILGVSSPVKFLGQLEVSAIATLKSIEHMNGVPVPNETLEEVIKVARKEYFEKINKMDGDYLTRNEKKGLKDFVKEKVDKMHDEEVKSAEEAYKECLIQISNRKSECKDYKRFEMRFIKAKYNPQYLSTRKFRECIETAMKDKENDKAQVNECFRQRNKGYIKKFVTVALIVGGGVIAWNLASGQVHEWIETNVVKEIQKMYGEEVEKYLKTKHTELVTKFYAEAVDKGLQSADKIKLVHEINTIWDQKVLTFQSENVKFYKNRESNFQKKFKETRE